MKKSLAFLAACLFISTAAFSELKIAGINGTVEVIKHNGPTFPAQIGNLLELGDIVKTAADSKAVLVMDNKTRIWVKQDSELQITSTGDENYFSLLAGKLRAKVKGLSGKKFKVSTPVSVASIRGTEFVMSSDGILAVLEGNVEFSDANLSKIVAVMEGMLSSISETGAVNDSRAMTEEEKSQLQNEWNNLPTEQQSQIQQEQQQPTKEADNSDKKEEVGNELRYELKDVISEAKTDAGLTRELSNEIKDSDMSAGRSLIDVHGNLVRVEQHLTRPDDKTIQIQNLTKRSGYTYSDKYGWGYHGGSGSRLDIMEIKIRMNMGLPEQLSEWPSFLSGKSDDMHPESIVLRFSNQSDEIKNVGVWTLKDQPAEKAGELTKEDRLVFSAYINDYKIDPDYDPANISLNPTGIYKDGTNADGSATDDLWAWGISPQIKISKTENGVTTTKYVRIGTEGYAINNGGKILNIKDFTNSSENPFVVLKQIAGEQIIFCRDVTGHTSEQSYATSTDLFNKGNIDLVTTPDLIISIAQKLASELGDLSKSTTDKSIAK